MRFNKLDVPYQWKEEFTKYPHGLSIFEALSKWVARVNSMVTNINQWNEYLGGFTSTFGEVPQQMVELKQEMTVLVDSVNSDLTTITDEITGLADTLLSHLNDYATLEQDYAQHKLDYATQVDLKLTNLFVNGNILTDSNSDGLADGFSTLVGAAASINNGQQITRINTASPILITTNYFKFTNNHSYYFKCKFDSLLNDVTLTIRLRNTTTDYTTFSVINLLVNGSNSFTNKYVSTSTNTGNIYLLFNSGADGEAFTIDDLVFIDLTDVFGVENEPTKEEMDALISVVPNQWWDGELKPSQKLLLNWQLKMIRQNRNAIVALGGTIV